MIKNDWMLAGINNPDMELDDLVTVGDINTGNTQFLSKDEYLKSDYIKKAFTDLSGNFDKQKFDQFYTILNYRWLLLLENDFPQGMKLDPFDTDANKPNRRVKQLELGLGVNMNNPDRQSIGIEGWRTTSDPIFTRSELAQQQKVYDPALGKFIDYSPDEISLFDNPVGWFKNLVSEDPLVLAQYDEDTEDPDGTKHFKGEYKLNERGTYYYEKLNGRSVVGKQVLSSLDILSRENSSLNKIDFMDSDDKEKSIPGVIFKNVAMLAPMFTPLAEVYYGCLIGKELMKSLPMLYSFANNFLPIDLGETPEILSTLAAKGEQLSSGTSEYAKEHTFAFENFANLMSDVALQWGQQKLIAKQVNKFTGGGQEILDEAEKKALALYNEKAGTKAFATMTKNAENWKETALGRQALNKFYEPVVEALEQKQRLAADAALSYMALVSNYDMYNSMLEKGATQEEAGWVSLFSTIGMFGIDRQGIGEVFFDELKSESTIQARKALKKEFAQAMSDMKMGTSAEKLSAARKALNWGKEHLANFWQDVKDHNLGFVGKAAGEGLEEMSEEFISDSAKFMYTALGNLGLYDAHAKDVMDFDTMFERYTMSFLGGAAGGGLFYAKEKILGNSYNKTNDKDLVELIRDKKSGDLRKMLQEFKDQGKVGSTTLSGTKFNLLDGQESPTWLTADTKLDSQNDIIADRVLDKINGLESIIIGNNANLSDDELFDNMVLGDMRYFAFKNMDGIKEASHVTGYYSRFNKLLNNLLTAETNLKNAIDSKSGNPDDPNRATDADKRDTTSAESVIKLSEVEKFLQAVDNARKEMLDFLSGDSSLDYARKLSFALDPTLNSAFLDLDFFSFLKDNFDFSKQEDVQYVADFQEKWRQKQKDVMFGNSGIGIDKAWELYKKFEQEVAPELLAHQELGQTYKQTLDKLTAFLKSVEDVDYSKAPNWDTRFADENGNLESDEEYEDRVNYAKIKEIDQDANEDVVKEYNERMAKLLARIEKIKKARLEFYKEQLKPYQEFIQSLGGKLDSLTARLLTLKIDMTLNQIMKQELSYPISVKGSSILVSDYESIVQELLQSLKSDDPDVRSSALTIAQNKARDKELGRFSERVEAIKAKFKKDPKGKFLDFDKSIKAAIEAVVEKLKELPEDSEEYESLLKIIDTLKGFIWEPMWFGPTGKQGKDDTEAIRYLEGLVESEVISSDIYKYREENVFDYLCKYIDKYKFRMEQIDEDNYDPYQGHIDTKLQVLIDELSDYDSIINQHLRAVGILNDGERSGLFNDEQIDVLEEIDGELLTVSKIVPAGMKLAADYLIPFRQELGVDSNLEFMVDIFNMDGVGVTESTSQAVIRKLDTAAKAISQIESNIASNPIFKFLTDLKSSTSSPVLSIFDKIAKTTGDKELIKNVEELLNEVRNSFINGDTALDFELNSTLMSDMEVLKKLMQLTDAYIYSASNTPSVKNVFGHNRQINNFAQANKDKLLKEWTPLPEIDGEYALVLLQETSLLRHEIEKWIQFSENNSLNKSTRLIKTEAKLLNLRHKFLSGIINNLKFSVGDKDYDLGENVNIEPKLEEKDSSLRLQLIYKIELLLHNNFQDLINQGVSAENIFDAIWKLIFTENNLEDIAKQKTSKLDENMKEISPLHKALYLLSIFVDDPSNYYKSLLGFVNDNNSIAPLTVQQTCARTGEAFHNSLFKIGMKSLFNATGSNLSLSENIFHIDGCAGAGKTSVVAKAIRQRYSDQQALCIGPTTSLAVTLSQSLGEPKSYDFDTIFPLLINDYVNVQSDYDSNVGTFIQELRDDEYKHSKTKHTKYFEFVYDAVSDTISVSVKPDKITFKSDIKEKLIFVDEAAHLDNAQIAILNAFARKNKASVYLISDTTQSGNLYFIFDNLSPRNIFCARGDRLSESIRTGNILKLKNDNKLGKLVERINESQKSGVFEFEQIIKNLSFELLKLHINAYIGEDSNGNKTINGDLIDAKVEDFITMIPKDSKIGFIGEENSPLYQKLKDLGFDVSEPLSETRVAGRKFMQGQEFDYTIIDSPNFPTKSEFINLKPSKQIEFVKRLRTLASRAKKGSIFVTTGLSDIIGTNVIDKRTADGYSIAQQVNIFQEVVKRDLESLLLEPYQKLKESSKKDTSKKSDDGGGDNNNNDDNDNNENNNDNDNDNDNNDDDSKDPRELKKDDSNVKTDDDGFRIIETNPEILNVLDITEEGELKNKIDKVKSELEEETANSDPKEPDETIINESNITFMVEANTVAPVLGVEKVPSKDGKYSVWVAPKEYSPVRRNLQVFMKPGSEVESYADKRKLLNQLELIQSAVIFENSTVPNVGHGIDKTIWENRKLQLEIRPYNPEIDKLGIDRDLDDDKVAIEINGLPFVVSLVLRLDGIRTSLTSTEKYSALFDICLMNNPETLNRSIPTIQNNIAEKLSTLSPKKRKEAEEFSKNIPVIVEKYKELLETIVKNENIENGFTIDLTNKDDVVSNKTTRIVSRRTPIRLGGDYDIRDVFDAKDIEDVSKNHHSFDFRNQHAVISDVYILGKSNDLLQGHVSEDIFGKACVFVSTNKTLTPDELPLRWINQKLEPDLHTPEVRCILLDNAGIHWSELMYHKVLSYLEGVETKQGKPWTMESMGIRMFQSMWNFRASLDNFLIALNEFKSKYGYDSTDLVQISAAEKDVFDVLGKNADLTSPEALEIISKRNVAGRQMTADDVINLNNFNLEDCVEIPNIRLGLSKTKSGAYVRNFPINPKSGLKNIFGDDNANLLVIGEELAIKYFGLIDGILSLLVSNANEYIESEDVTYSVKSMNTRLVHKDGSPISPREYIGKSSTDLTLSGMIRTDQSGIYLSDTDVHGNKINGYKIDTGSIFSFFPKAISSICKKVNLEQAGKLKTGTEIAIGTIDNAGNEGEFHFDLSKLFVEIERNQFGRKVKLLDKSPGDLTLERMFNFIFHGTNEPLRGVKQEDGSYSHTGRVTGCPFPFGIFIDPDLEIIEDKTRVSEINIHPQERSASGRTTMTNYVLLKCGTARSLFNVDCDIIPGGMKVNLSALIERYNNPDKFKEEVKEVEEVKDEPKGPKFSEDPEFWKTQPESFYNGFVASVGNGEIEDSKEGFDLWIPEFVDTEIKDLLDEISESSVVDLNDGNHEQVIDCLKYKGYKDPKVTEGKLKVTREIDNVKGHLTIDDIDYTSLKFEEDKIEGGKIDLPNKNEDSKSLYVFNENEYTHQQYNDMIEKLKNGILNESELVTLKTVISAIGKGLTVNKDILNSLIEKLRGIKDDQMIRDLNRTMFKYKTKC